MRKKFCILPEDGEPAGSEDGRFDLAAQEQEDEWQEKARSKKSRRWKRHEVWLKEVALYDEEWQEIMLKWCRKDEGAYHGQGWQRKGKRCGKTKKQRLSARKAKALKKKKARLAKYQAEVQNHRPEADKDCLWFDWEKQAGDEAIAQGEETGHKGQAHEDGLALEDHWLFPWRKDERKQEKTVEEATICMRSCTGRKSNGKKQARSGTPLINQGGVFLIRGGPGIERRYPLWTWQTCIS